jgi:formylglycine-generating enzyme required for sulfatase activity
MERQHQVILTQDFFIMNTEVTQSQWEAVMGNNPSYFTGCGGNCPVEMVSWYDIQDFIAALNAMDGKTYRLPTESEWEYAARAGTTTAFPNGDISETSCGYDPNLDAIGWYCGNADNRTRRVAQKRPNAWKLYDMSGNVWEWCQDWAGEYPDGVAVNPTGAETGGSRIARGGAGWTEAILCRSAKRGISDPSSESNGLGFRLAISANE